jgi:hypothetical protein
MFEILYRLFHSTISQSQDNELEQWLLNQRETQ